MLIKERIARGFARFMSWLLDDKSDPGVVITPLSDEEIKHFKEIEASSEWVTVRPIGGTIQ